MICEKCQEEYTVVYGSGRFCGAVCARGFSTFAKRAEINEKVSQTLKAQGNEVYARLHTEEVRNRANIARKATWERKAEEDNRDFSELGLPKRKQIVFDEQGNCCSGCGIVDWRGKELTFELEHKDGDNKNNIRENLEVLCPNCHSQTSTWRGRNKVKKVSDEQMIAMLRATESLHQTLLNLGMAAKGGNYKRVKRLAAENDIRLKGKSGLNSFNSSLTPENLVEIKYLREHGVIVNDIKDLFDVSRSTIQKVLNGSYGIARGDGGI